MGRLDQSTVEQLHEKVMLFTKEATHSLSPAEVRDTLTKKINDMKSSDAEDRFVTMSAFMNLLSAVFQATFGLMLKSMSVLSSAIDSLLDFFLGMFNLFLLTKSKRKSNTAYNYGYGKLQGFGGLFQGSVMLFFGLIMAYFSFMKLLDSAPVKRILILIILMALDFIGGMICVAYYHMKIKKSQNMIVVGTLKKLYGGLLFNVSITAGLLIILFGQKYMHAERYFIDGIVGLIVAGYMCFNAGSLLLEGFGMLMDKSLSPEDIKAIKETIKGYEGEQIARWGDLRTRSSGTTKFIEFSAYFDTKKHSFGEIYKICLFLKKHLEQDIEDSFVTIVPKPLEK